jgi:hypothetical protein
MSDPRKHVVRRCELGRIDVEATLDANPGLREVYDDVHTLWVGVAQSKKLKEIRQEASHAGWVTVEELINHGLSEKYFALRLHLDRALMDLNRAPREHATQLWCAATPLRVQYCSDVCFALGVEAQRHATSGPDRTGYEMFVWYNEAACVFRCQRCKVLVQMPSVRAFREARMREEAQPRR